MARAFTFPGQSSQAVSMGKDLTEAFGAAREVFEEIDDALSDKLSKLMFEDLKQTAFKGEEFRYQQHQISFEISL